MYQKQEKKNFKQTLTVDESRRKREDKLKSLRKEKKDEILQKRRKGGNDDKEKDSGLEKKLQNLPKLVQLLNSNDKTEQLEATIQFRKLLSIEKNPPIDEVIDEGCLPIFIKFLQNTDFPQLQFEAAWAITNIASGTSLHTEKVIQENAVAVFIKLLASNYDDVREQAVWALGNIAGDSTKCRNFVLKSGVLPNLLKLIAENPKISLLRNSTWTLSNLCRGKPIPEFSLVSPSLSVLKVLLYSDDDEILTDSCWAISYLSDGPNDRIQAVIDSGVVPRLTELLQHNQTGVQTPALRTIGNIVTGTDNQTQVIIKSGALQYVGTLLKHSKKSLRKEACWTISNITAGNKDQIQSIIDTNLIPPLIQILEKDEFEVKKEAAWAVSNATSGGTMKQIQYMVERGCIKPLCDLLTEKDIKIINVALEGLENILNSGAKFEKENPYCDMIEEAGGIEKIEELQNHESNDIYEKSSRIIEQFFFSDENEDEIKNDMSVSNNFNFDNSETTDDFNFN